MLVSRIGQHRQCDEGTDIVQKCNNKKHHMKDTHQNYNFSPPMAVWTLVIPTGKRRIDIQNHLQSDRCFIVAMCIQLTSVCVEKPPQDGQHQFSSFSLSSMSCHDILVVALFELTMSGMLLLLLQRSAKRR